MAYTAEVQEESVTYYAAVPRRCSSIEIRPIPSSSRSALTINGISIESFSGTNVDLNFGQNWIEVVVEAEDKSAVGTYTLIVTRSHMYSSMATLANVQVQT